MTFHGVGMDFFWEKKKESQQVKYAHLFITAVLNSCTTENKSYRHKRPPFLSLQPRVKGYNSSCLLNLGQHLVAVII